LFASDDKQIQHVLWSMELHANARKTAGRREAALRVMSLDLKNLEDSTPTLPVQVEPVGFMSESSDLHAACERWTDLGAMA
jgi:hypothetical protein